MLFAVSRTRGTRNAVLRRTRFNDAAEADELLDSCKSALEELLNLQMQEKENDPDPVVGVITVEAVEFMLRRRLTDDDWGKIEMCGGLIKHAQAWREHLCRKTVVAAVGQTYKTTEDYELDGYNRLVNTNPELIPLDSVGYADRLPGTIIAVRIESSQRVDYKPNIDELMAKVHSATIPYTGQSIQQETQDSVHRNKLADK